MPGDLNDENTASLGVGHYESRTPLSEITEDFPYAADAKHNLKPKDKAMSVVMKSLKMDAKGELDRPRMPA